MEHPAVAAFVESLSRHDWVSDLWLHGSLATGDHQHGVSDVDLVGITSRAPSGEDARALERLHRRLDATWCGSALGCTYVDLAVVDDRDAVHPTWTHGRLVYRRLSQMVRGELLDHGQVLLGREPADVLGTMTPSDVRDAAREELSGYWSWAVRRPWLFVDSRHADLALLSMARARVTLATGALVSKTEAVAHVRAPAYVIVGLQRRRASLARPSPFAPVLAHHAWHDVRRTIAESSHM